jgi:hypothetical protein
MGFKPWEYFGYYFDDCISLYINEESGFGCTMGYMAKNMSHLRVK